MKYTDTLYWTQTHNHIEFCIISYQPNNQFANVLQTDQENVFIKIDKIGLITRVEVKKNV